MSSLLKDKTPSFALVLSGVDEKTPNLEDMLYQAGCDDALISFSSGTVYLEFDIESEDVEFEILDAIFKVEKAGIGATVESLAPEPYVSLSDIARRLDKSRQGVSLLATGQRGDGSFPKPLFKVDNKSPLWRWSTVLEWALCQQSNTDSYEKILEEAKLIEDINAALDARNSSSYAHRELLHSKLVGSTYRP